MSSACFGRRVRVSHLAHAFDSGAVELARDRKSCHRSRHVDRRFFKVRECEAAGLLKVHYVPTDANVADLLTKGLPLPTFRRHRAATLATLTLRSRSSRRVSISVVVFAALPVFGLLRRSHDYNTRQGAHTS